MNIALRRAKSVGNIKRLWTLGFILLVLVNEMINGESLDGRRCINNNHLIES